MEVLTEARGYWMPCSWSYSLSWGTSVGAGRPTLQEWSTFYPWTISPALPHIGFKWWACYSFLFLPAEINRLWPSPVSLAFPCNLKSPTEVFRRLCFFFLLMYFVFLLWHFHCINAACLQIFKSFSFLSPSSLKHTNNSYCWQTDNPDIECTSRLACAGCL